MSIRAGITQIVISALIVFQKIKLKQDQTMAELDIPATDITGAHMLLTLLLSLAETRGYFSPRDKIRP